VHQLVAGPAYPSIYGGGPQVSGTGGLTRDIGTSPQAGGGTGPRTISERDENSGKAQESMLLDVDAMLERIGTGIAAENKAIDALITRLAGKIG